ncbi:hypothetical protein OHA25_37035 [Nonomuraea sp. NBC_00507]|uniref:hypothetical protein n=1 Tax=Nonomuraea sp. NBC_00507 TaxID=2976002 RepID=UPI002E18EB36
MAIGQQVAVTGDSDGTVRAWDLATGKRLQSLTGLSDPTGSVGLGELNGKQIVMASTAAGDGVTDGVTCDAYGDVQLWSLAGPVPTPR